MKKVRIGLVGILRNARGHGIECLKNRNARVVAGCDVSPAGREQGQKWYGVPMYPSLAEMIKNEKLDAVIISTPNWTHRQLTVDALKAGLKVLCEKPMANTLSDSKAMAEAAKKVQRIPHNRV